MSIQKVSSARWWKEADEVFKYHLSWLIDKAKLAEKAELLHAKAPHECGHRFEITIRSSSHGGIEGLGPKSHKDANYWDELPPVVVRASSLRRALLVAAGLPGSAWLTEEEKKS